MNGSEDPEPWWNKALVAALAGLLFSLVMSALFSLGSAFRIAPLVAVERAGIDFGMMAYTAFSGRPQQTTDDPRYVFVDVDRAACEAFSEAPEACVGGRPIPPALTVAFARAVRGSGASVVLIDVRAPEDEEERARLADAMTATDGPWMIASLGVRPRRSTRQMEVVAEPETLLGPSDRAALRRGRLVLAPFVTSTDAFAADGIIRHYPLLEQVHGLGGAAEPRGLPSAPFLAASLTDPANAEAILCRYYAETGDTCASSGRPGATADIRFGERTDMRNRIFYSLPSLAAAGAEQGRVYRDRYLGFYDRIDASALLDGDGFSWPPELMQGAVVVLGTSAPEGHDWHVTPVGPMAGPEILLNAIRAFSEYSPLSEPSVTATAGERFAAAWRGFAIKVGAMTSGTLIMLVGWFAIFWISDCWTAAPRWVRQAACVTIFLVILLVTAMYELFSGIASLERNAQVSEATDLLTPLLALGLEGFAEAARTFAQASEALVAWALARGLTMARTLNRSASDEVA
ncbi:MAG: CHASE2 domain-containing protein [Alphaproteobacteria bacterium]|nr:CHASE2 domain-containing protein [Alphaproteobacteria bacterium]MBU2378947.1 CHASE2 domain-containing protein [Alphaproteobacteria bacterium]